VAVPLSQSLLDSLAIAWSRLDRARPRDRGGVPGLLLALDEWLRWAVRVDGELEAAMGWAYLAARPQREGGAVMAGLRAAHHLVEQQGHPIDDLVTISAGSPALFYDATWKPWDDLPALRTEAGDAEDAYRRHLGGQPARGPASRVTTFLLTAAREIPVSS
jgi:hypothetical protein